jgi:hypothetical protein
MKKLIASGILAAFAASPSAAAGSALPGVSSFLQIGAVSVADTGPGAFGAQDPFAKAAKVVYGRLRLEGRTLEWDKRDYATSSASAHAARTAVAKEKGQGIHDMSEILGKAGKDAWVVLRDAKSGESFFVFAKTDADGETSFPNANISGAKEKKIVDGKLWLTFPGDADGSYQLVRLVPDAANAVDRSHSFTKGRLDGSVAIDSRPELDLLLEQPAFAEAMASMKAAKLNESASYADGIRGFVDGEGQSLVLSQDEDGTLSVGLKKGRDTLYEITAAKNGAELTAVGQ